MRAWQAILILTVLGVLTAPSSVKADELHLSNGDVISGQLVRMEKNQLFFKTAYAGEIKVNWSEVINLITDGFIEVILVDGKVVSGISKKAPVNKIQIETDKRGEPSDFKLSKVTAINPKKKPTVKISGRINAGLTQERGNTDDDTLGLDSEFNVRSGKNLFTFWGELNKERAQGDTTVENWEASGRYSYFLTHKYKWFLYAQGFFEHDKFADLNLRSTLGVGPGYQFFESEILNLSVSAGPAWVDENFDKAEDNDFAAGQWLINYDQYFFNKTFQLFHRQKGLRSLSNSGNWLLWTRQGLRFPIYKGFTTTLQYNYDYNNDPSPDADKKWDSKLMFLLGWQFEN